MSTTKVSALAEKTNTGGGEELLISDSGTSKRVSITNVLPDDGVLEKHLNLVSTSSVPSLEAKGTTGSTSGYIKLNCSENSHGIKLLGPPHSAGANYTLTFPDDDGSANQKLTTNGSGVLTWTADANTVYTHPNHSGDVTSTADGATVIGAGKVITTKILDDNVTAAKLANSINTDIATGVTANTTANAALPKAGGTMTGNLVMGTNLVDGIDISARDAVLTSTTTTAGAALPKAGGTMTGDLVTTSVEIVATNSGSPFNVLKFTDADTGTAPNQAVGSIEFNSSDTGNTGVGAKIDAIAEDYDSNMAVRIFTGDPSSATEKMRITSAGQITVVKNAVGTMTTDNDGSFAMSASNNFKCTPGGNFALTFTSIVAQSGNILFINSGGHTISAHANTKVDATLLATISTAGTYLLAYFSDGTNVYMTNSAAYA